MARVVRGALPLLGALPARNGIPQNACGHPLAEGGGARRTGAVTEGGGGGVRGGAATGDGGGGAETGRERAVLAQSIDKLPPASRIILTRLVTPEQVSK